VLGKQKSAALEGRRYTKRKTSRRKAKPPACPSFLQGKKGGPSAPLRASRYEGNVTAEAAGLQAAALHEEKPEGKPHKTIQNPKAKPPA
jgi:hypothetical protein